MDRGIVCNKFFLGGGEVAGAAEDDGSLKAKRGG